MKTHNNNLKLKVIYSQKINRTPMDIVKPVYNIPYLEIGWIQVSLIRGRLQLLIDPDLCLITISLKHLILVGILKLNTTGCSTFIQGCTTLEEL